MCVGFSYVCWLVAYSEKRYTFTKEGEWGGGTYTETTDSTRTITEQQNNIAFTKYMFDFSVCVCVCVFVF